MRKTDIIFIRHGESANNVTYETVRNMFGDTISPEQYEIEVAKLHNPDCGVSPRGARQIEELVKFISSGGLSDTMPNPDEWKLFSSPMNRCMITSNAIGMAMGKRVTVMPFLYESDGCYETLSDHDTKGLPGMTAAEVTEKFSHLDCAPGMEEGWYKLEKKESRRHFYSRCKDIAEWIWKAHDQTPEERGFKTGMVLSVHGNLISQVLGELLQTGTMLITHHNTGMAHVQLWSNHDNTRRVPCLLYSNRVEHMRDHPELAVGGRVVEDHWIQELFEPLD